MSADTEALLEERGKIYGDANVQYSRVAEVWSGICGHPITALQAMLMMVGLKLVRAEMSPEHEDNLDDAHGYTTLAQRLLAETTPAKAEEFDGYYPPALPNVHVWPCAYCGEPKADHLEQVHCTKEGHRDQVWAPAP